MPATVMPVAVATVFAAYPAAVRTQLLEIRQLILEVAAHTDGVGPLLETLKWGQPSYLTEVSKSGTTVRIDQFDASRVAVLVNCQTSLIDSFRTVFPELEYSRNRAVLFSATSALPHDQLELFLENALTYKRSRR